MSCGAAACDKPAVPADMFILSLEVSICPSDRQSEIRIATHRSFVCGDGSWIIIASDVYRITGKDYTRKSKKKRWLDYK